MLRRECMPERHMIAERKFDVQSVALGWEHQVERRWGDSITSYIRHVEYFSGHMKRARIEVVF